VAPRDPFLDRLEREAEREGIPIVGPEEGTLLGILAGVSGAREILELGTAIGYSATWLARGSPLARVTSVEHEPSMARRAEGNIREAGLAGRVQVVVGEALEVSKGLAGPYDMIFNDIDKEDYPLILPRLKALLAPGGLLVTDNVLWGGRVAGRVKDAATQAIRVYNRALVGDGDMMTVILPLRDGVSLSLKRKGV
jgi:predicted O-methyltransferase YrrM